MKRIIAWSALILSAFMTTIPVEGNDEDVTRLTLEHTDGTQSHFNLADEPQMIIDGDSLVIKTSTLQTSVERAGLSHFHFTVGPVSAVSEVSCDVYTVSYSGNVLEVSGNVEGVLKVYDMDGRQVANFVALDGSAVADLNVLAPNIYVVAIPGKPSMKVLVK